jgi:hypothetical protein
MIWPIYLAASTVIYELFNLFAIDAVDILTYSFKGLLIASVPESLVGLFNNVVDVIIKSNLAKR